MTREAMFTQRDRLSDPYGLLALAVVGALASVVITGFTYGISNNIFHLPILAEEYNEAQFAQDAYMQSLRYFASGVWLALRGSARIVDPYWMFLVLLILSRIISFAGFLLCADLIGLRDRKSRLIFTALLCATPFLRNASLAGGGGLFVPFFQHSEIANGVSMLVVYFLLSGRLSVAIALNGVVFFLNAFYAVWNVLPIAFVALTWVVQKRAPLRDVLRKAAVGAAIAAVFAAPAFWMILSNPDFGKPLAFDYRDFLRFYWPYHFMFDENLLGARFAIVALIALGLLTFFAIGRAGRGFQLVLMGYVAVYALGVIAPLLTANPTILNLHLLRVGSLIHYLVSLGVLSLATIWWLEKDRLRAYLFAPLLLLFYCTPLRSSPYHALINLILTADVVVASFAPTIRRMGERALARWPRLMTPPVNLRAAAVTAVAIGLVVATVKDLRDMNKTDAWSAEWSTLGKWASTKTSPEAVFMMPFSDIHMKTEHPKEWSEEDDASFAAGVFDLESHRRIYVDFKRGAAAMWTPSYYALWRNRVEEVGALATHDDKLNYARTHGVTYVIELCGDALKPKAVLATQRLCVFDARADASALKSSKL